MREGVLEKYDVELIAASRRRVIDMAEDRELFRNAMREDGLEIAAVADRVASLEEGLAIAGEIGYPVVIRPSFTLGGSGGSIAYNREELFGSSSWRADSTPPRPGRCCSRSR